MEAMRLLYMLLTICTVTADSAWAHQPNTDQTLQAPRRPPPPPPPPKPLPTLETLDLTVASKYPDFIENMRKVFSEKGVSVCGMKKLSETVPSPQYGYIDIIASGTQTVTLGIDRTMIYVMGYRDRFNGKDRAFFFKDAYQNANSLFPNAQGKEYRVKLPYTGRYDDIGGRDKVQLGIKNFREHITKIYGRDKTTIKDFDNLQREFFILALQMVAEATRFKYISERIPKKEEDTLKVDAHVKALENNWGKLSKAIYDAETNNCVLKDPVSLDLVSPNKWTFDTVKKIDDVLALLLKRKNTMSSPASNDETNDNDSDEVALIASY